MQTQHACLTSTLELSVAQASRRYVAQASCLNVAPASCRCSHPQCAAATTPTNRLAARRRSFSHPTIARCLLLALCAGRLAGCAEPTPPPPYTATPREHPRVAVIHERPGEARIEGLGPIEGFAKGRDCTLMHCLELTLDLCGRGISYDELMGLSGAAFRTQFRVDHWDVGNPDPIVGDSCLPRLFTAIGWEYDLRVVRRDELSEVSDLRQAIARSIDRGMPVLAANIIPPEDWGIITGYHRDGSWTCRSYNGGAERADRPATGWPTAVVLLTRAGPRPAVHDAHADSIRHAIELFEKPRSGDYAEGDKALENWCEALATVRDRKYLHPNFWTYIGLIDARGAAARYLRSIAAEFTLRETHINAAADWYEKEVRLLLGGLENVPSERRYPDSMPPVEMRNRQVEVLRQAQSMERSAIEALKKAR